MKQLFLLCMCLLAFSEWAWASKARLLSLGPLVGADDDVQEVFQNPAKMFGFDDQLSIEFAPSGEAGVFHSTESAEYGVYVGHRAEALQELVDFVGTGLLPEQNPVEIFYGQKIGTGGWALGLFASKGEDKMAQAQTTRSGFRVGYWSENFEGYASYQFPSQAKVENLIQVRSEAVYQLGFQAQLGAFLIYSQFDRAVGKITPSGGLDTLRNSGSFSLGIEEAWGEEDSQIFAGLYWERANQTQGTTEIVRTQMPLYVGLEHKDEAGLIFRGFIQQSIIINSESSQPGGGAPATVDESGMTDTEVGFGAGFHHGPVQVDGVLSAGATGILATDVFLAQLSLTYYFE